MSINDQREANQRAYEHNPDTSPSAAEYDDYVRRIRAVAAANTNPYAPLGEAVRLAEQPLKLAAYRVAVGSKTRAEAEAVCAVHHTAANGASMPDSQISDYLDLLTAAYAAV